MKESQLENKTEIATNDYVRMVDENNNSVKIKKDSFMAAIRDALPSIISDGATGGGSVLSIINGALKTRTDANLASVLGVNKKITIENIGNGAGAFSNHFANGFLVGLQSDRKKYCLYFISSEGVGYGNVVWLNVDKIAGGLAVSTNDGGTITINNADAGTSFTEYYIPIG